MKAITPQDFQHLFAPRKRESHKGDYGHLLVIAGSRDMLGAGYLTSLAALRSGAGLVTYALPATSYKKFDACYPEIIPYSVDDHETGFFHEKGILALCELLEKKNAVVLGPGIGCTTQTISFVRELLPHLHLPLVIDADALNCLVDHLDLLHARKSPTILTPHPGEMSRLVKKETAWVQAHREQIVSDVAMQHRVFVVLKGAGTIIATPEGECYLNPTGNPGMATAGTGDVLAGMIGGFLAQGCDPLSSVLGAVYMHGLAGDLAAVKDERSLVASDLLAKLPDTFAQIHEELHK